jgi:hypothetical protein
VEILIILHCTLAECCFCGVVDGAAKVLFFYFFRGTLSPPVSLSLALTLSHFRWLVCDRNEMMELGRHQQPNSIFIGKDFSIEKVFLFLSLTGQNCFRGSARKCFFFFIIHKLADGARFSFASSAFEKRKLMSDITSKKINHVE